MLFPGVLNANSPLPAITDGGRNIVGTVWMLCCVELSDWFQAYHLGWGGGSPSGWRWEVGKTLWSIRFLCSFRPWFSAPWCVWAFKTWKLENLFWTYFFIQTSKLFFVVLFFFLQRRRGQIILGCYFETQKWNWVLYLLMYKWRRVKDVLGTVISKYNLYSKSTVSRYYPNPIAGACRLGWPKAMQWTVASCLLSSATSLFVFPLWSSFFKVQQCPCKYWVRKTNHDSDCDFYYILQSKKNQSSPEWVVWLISAPSP